VRYKYLTEKMILMSEATKSNDHSIETSALKEDSSRGPVTSYERVSHELHVSQTQLRQEQKVIEGRDEEKKERTARETIIPENMEALFEKTRHIRVANLFANPALRNNLKLHPIVKDTLLSLVDSGLADQKARLVLAKIPNDISGVKDVQLHLSLRDDNSSEVDGVLFRHQDKEVRRMRIDSWAAMSEEAASRNVQLKRFADLELVVLRSDRTEQHRWVIAGETTNESVQEEILANFRKDPDAATALIMNNRFLTEKTRAKANEVAVLLKSLSFKALMRGSKRR
ncbi:MAG: hypothetical protein ACHQX1_00395, partial [Candidatus Micrarchaeales archaeon]